MAVSGSFADIFKAIRACSRENPRSCKLRTFSSLLAYFLTMGKSVAFGASSTRDDWNGAGNGKKMQKASSLRLSKKKPEMPRWKNGSASASASHWVWDLTALVATASSTDSTLHRRMGSKSFQVVSVCKYKMRMHHSSKLVPDE